MKIGYIGLGAMGGALARRLVRDHELVVWDMSKKAVDELVEAGASTTATAAALARQCEVVILCLPRSSDVGQVLFGAGGLAEGLSAGQVVVDQTSGIPSETNGFASKLAKAGVGMIDAPVAGGVPSALAGTITIMISGPHDAYEKALPALEAISPKLYHCSSRVGDAQAVKLVNNSINAGYRMATLEIVALGRKLGLTLPAMTEALNGGWGRNFTSKQLLTSLVQGKASTNFALSLMVKDLNQALSLGMECGAPMPVSNIARGLMQIGLNTLGAHATLDDAVKLIESMALTHLATPGDALPRDAPDGAATFGAVGIFGCRGVEDDVLEHLARQPAVVVLDGPDQRSGRCLSEATDLPSVIIDFTKRSPAECANFGAELAARGVAVLDAALAGGTPRLDGGPGTVLCGGPADAFAGVRPVFDALGIKAIHCGASGSGQIAGLLVNAVAACNRIVIYENAAMGRTFGLDLDELAAIVNAGSGWSGEAERILPALSSGGETTRITLGEIVADLTALARLGFANGAPLLIANEVRATFEAQAGEVGADATLDALKRRYESAARTDFGTD